MTWRKPTKEDLVRGTMLRFNSMDDAYNKCTIISTNDIDSAWPFVTVARPMAWANTHYSSKQPMLSCEVFDIDLSKILCETSDIEVCEVASGIRKFLT